jgi:HTH-type transcriptional regulator / antitoxin HigA
MTTHISKDIETHWAGLCSLLTIRNESDYDSAIQQMNELLDDIGDNERHPLYGLLDTLGTLLHAYEEQHHSIPGAGGIETLRYFMDEHGLSESDLPEIGSHEVVSKILSGSRELNIRQVRLLGKRFQVSPAVFI